MIDMQMQIGLPGMQHEVVVIAHQAVGEHLGVKSH
jgi:hypothetical protein